MKLTPLSYHDLRLINLKGNMATQLAALLAPKPFKYREVREKSDLPEQKVKHKKLCRLVLPKKEIASC